MYNTIKGVVFSNITEYSSKDKKKQVRYFLIVNPLIIQIKSSQVKWKPLKKTLMIFYHNPDLSFILERRENDKIYIVVFNVT